MLLVFDRFDEVNVLSLAEVAYVFTESDFIVRTHKQPLVLAYYRRDLTGNDTPNKRILVKVIVGKRGDWQKYMFELVSKMAESGS